MNRRRIRIDFASTRQRWDAPALGIALVAVLIAVGAAIHVVQLNDQTRELTEQLNAAQRSERRAAVRSIPTASITLNQARSVNDAVRRLNFEWEQMFAALRRADEAAGRGPGRVALLTLEPDPAAGLVKLTAEARSLNAMLKYQKHLETQAEVESALIAKHEVQLEDPQTPVRFSVEARMRPGLGRQP